MSKKTLAMRVLDSHSIGYQIRMYPDTVRDAVEIAELLAIPREQVFKTLVAVPKSGKPLLVMLPGSHQMDLKKLASGLVEKKIKLASHVEAEKLTGLKVGGISPLALMNKRFRVILDESALLHESICVSAGKKGINLELSPTELQNLISASILDVKKTS